MTQYLIIDTATRVIIRETTDNPPATASYETAVVVAVPINLAGGPWKLDVDNVTLLTPTQADIDNSGIDPVRNALLSSQAFNNLKTIVNDLATNGVTLAKAQQFFQALKATWQSR